MSIINKYENKSCNSPHLSIFEHDSGSIHAWIHGIIDIKRKTVYYKDDNGKRIKTIDFIFKTKTGDFSLTVFPKE